MKKSINPKGWQTIYYAILIAFGVLGIIQCFWFQPFTADEPAILDPAIQFANHHNLTIPSAGPGSGHSDAYFYQLPLHALVLGGWLKLFGVSALSAQLFSFLLGLLAISSLSLFKKSFGIRFVAITSLFLFSEKVFFGRMTMIRYDGIPILLTLTALGLLIGSKGMVTSRRRWIVSGVCIALAAMSNFLYGIYAIALPTCLLWGNGQASLSAKLRLVFAFCLAGTLATAPMLFYIYQHFNAFYDQFIFQIIEHRTSTQSFLIAEAKKYATYYSRHYFAPIFYLLAGFWIVKKRRRGDRETAYVVFAKLAFVATILLTLASGSKHWHQGVVSPALVLLAAAGFSQALEAREKLPADQGIFAKAVIVLGLLAIGSGLINGPIRMAIQSLVEEKSRSHLHLANACDRLIPEGASVYGPRQLLIKANQKNWDFVADYGDLFRTSPELGIHGEFEWIVCRADQAAPAFLDPQAYKEVSSFQSPLSTFDRLVKSNILIRYYLYSSDRPRYLIFRKSA